MKYFTEIIFILLILSIICNIIFIAKKENNAINPIINSIINPVVESEIKQEQQSK